MAKQAIQGRRINAFAVDPGDLTVIGVDTEDGPEHPLWDERIKLPLDDAMILNISALGVKEPVIVRKVKAEDDFRIEVVDGRRRVLHARKANEKLASEGEGLISVPVMLAKGGDDLMETYSIALNEIRQNDVLLTKIAKCVRMLARNGDDTKATAIAFGVSTQTIRTWVKISELSAPVRKAVDEGKLAPTAALKLHGLSASDQKEQLQKALESAPKQKNGRVSGSNIGGRPTKDLPPLRERLEAAKEKGRGLKVLPDEVERILQALADQE